MFHRLVKEINTVCQAEKLNVPTVLNVAGPLKCGGCLLQQTLMLASAADRRRLQAYLANWLFVAQPQKRLQGWWGCCHCCAGPDRPAVQGGAAPPE